MNSCYQSSLPRCSVIVVMTYIKTFSAYSSYIENTSHISTQDMLVVISSGYLQCMVFPVHAFCLVLTVSNPAMLVPILSLHFFGSVYMYVNSYVYIDVCVHATVLTQRSEDNLWEVVLSSIMWLPGQTQADRLSSKHLYLLSYLWHYGDLKIPYFYCQA